MRRLWPADLGEAVDELEESVYIEVLRGEDASDVDVGHAASVEESVEGGVASGGACEGTSGVEVGESEDRAGESIPDIGRWKLRVDAGARLLHLVKSRQLTEGEGGEVGVGVNGCDLLNHQRRCESPRLLARGGDERGKEAGLPVWRGIGKTEGELRGWEGLDGDRVCGGSGREVGEDELGVWVLGVEEIGEGGEEAVGGEGRGVGGGARAGEEVGAYAVKGAEGEEEGLEDVEERGGAWEGRDDVGQLGSEAEGGDGGHV